MEIIPAIDIIGGRCVRLKKGDFNQQTLYSSDPLELARTFETWGIERLHMVDLDGAREGKIVNISLLGSITRETKLIVDYGGGIRTENDIKIALDHGASKVSVGSIAASDPEKFIQWIAEFGSDRIILGADHRNGIISVNAWKQNSRKAIFTFLEEFIAHGIVQVICTDINRDGMLTGPSTEIYRKILSRWPYLYLIASGGISSPADLRNLQETGVPAVIVGKAIFEKRITQEDIRPYLTAK